MKKKTAIILTILNLLIMLFTIFSLTRVSEYNKSINSVRPTFDYTETDEGILLNLQDHGQVHLKFGKGGVSITDSYLYDNPRSISDILMFTQYYAAKLGYKMERSNSELIGEYRLHTILYQIGYKQEQTGTLNWDYEKDPRWYVNAASSVIGWLGV